MLNIVVPMAGRGSRFANAGYTLPKPLIPVHGKPMIEVVTNNIRPNREHRFVYICLQEHIERYDLVNELNRIAPGCAIVPVDKVTEGAACTVLLAKEFIDNNDGMMIANSDQYVDIDINKYLESMKEYDGLIMTMTANDNKWSFIKYDENGFVTLLREKEVISDEATVGIYNYKHGADFIHFAEQMINKNIRVNNEFYVAPVYNEMVEAGQKIVYFNIGSLDNGMYGLGVPEDLNKFLQNSLSKKCSSTGVYLNE